MITSFLQRMVTVGHARSCQRCNVWSGLRVARLRPKALLDVGCADGAFLFQYLDYQPELFCGIEASPTLKMQAENRGIMVKEVVLHGLWPYEIDKYDVVHC